MAAPDQSLPDIKLDTTALYREDVFTDRRAGTIRVMTPVTVDGAVDAARPVLYAGQTQLMTQILSFLGYTRKTAAIFDSRFSIVDKNQLFLQTDL